MGKLIPIILILAGVGGGIGAGIMLRPSADADMAAMDDERGAEMPSDDGSGEPADDGYGDPADDQDEPAAKSGDYGDGPALSAIEYVALRRQLIVPLVDGNRVGALIVLSLSIEAVGGNIELIYDLEPKLRDEFLQVLFRHANTGGFDGMFTTSEAMNDLRSALNAAARDVLGSSVVQQVLITEILRQEI